MDSAIEKELLKRGHKDQVEFLKSYFAARPSSREYAEQVLKDYLVKSA